jgi:hypothetical protein
MTVKLWDSSALRGPFLWLLVCLLGFVEQNMGVQPFPYHL